MKTLANYRGNVRGLLVDIDYDSTLIDQAINWAVYELCTNNRLRIMEDSATLTASQGDTTLTMPATMMTLIKEGFYLTSPQKIELGKNYMEYGDFMKAYPNFATQNQQQAYTWTDFGNKVRFSAPLNAAHTFQVDFLKTPPTMTADADQCIIPDRYEELVSKSAFARIMEINEDYAEAAQERDNFTPLRTTFIQKEARGTGFKTGPGIMRTNRGRVGKQWRADRDF